jgi:hypothetical protein
MRTPGPVATQVNERLGSSSVTTYSVGGIRGCSIRTRDPTVSGLVQASNRGHRRRPLRPPLDLAQHLPHLPDRRLDVDRGALLHRAILPPIGTGD